MRLLFCIDSLECGGSQRQLVWLASELGARHQIEFFVYHPHLDYFRSELDRLGVTVHEGHRGPRLRRVLTLRNLIRHRQYDCVLAFLENPSLYAELALLARDGPPLVVSFRAEWRQLAWRPQQYVRQQLHRVARSVTVNSYETQARLRDSLSWLSPKVVVILNGVDTSVFVPSPSSAARVEAPNEFLALGRVDRLKNPAALITALSEYRRRFGKPPVVRWAGNINAGGKMFYSELCDTLHREGLQDHWTWLGERRDVPHLLRSHDALIHPSLSEGLPNAICEALACGRPVLASKVGDHSRIVRDGRTGYLFNPDDPVGIAESLFKFVNLSASARRRMGEHARAFAETHLSIGALAASYEALFEKLASNDPGCEAGARAG